MWKMLRVALLFGLIALEVPGAQSRVQFGAVVSPDTVRIGDEIRVVIRIRTPSGASIETPLELASYGRVDTITAPWIEETSSEDESFIEQRITYLLRAWDVGSIVLPLRDATVSMDGETQVVPLSDLSVFVASVLPQPGVDSVVQPKPARPKIDSWGINWWVVLLILAVIIVLALIARWLLKRRQEGEMDVAVWAIRELDSISGLRLMDSGAYNEHAIRIGTVIRTYLLRSLPVLTHSLTSQELTSRISHYFSEFRPLATIQLFNNADTAKFSRDGIERDTAAVMDQHARDVIRQIEELRAKEAEAIAAGKLLHDGTDKSHGAV